MRSRRLHTLIDRASGPNPSRQYQTAEVGKNTGGRAVRSPRRGARIGHCQKRPNQNRCRTNSPAVRPMQNTSHAVMAQRAELKNSLDDFPTPPWATRALLEHVIVGRRTLNAMTCLEPACGRGHMAVAL